MGESALGLVSLVVGGCFSVAVAWVSRPRAQQEQPTDDELSSVEGIAQVVAGQGAQIHQLEQQHPGTVAQIGALTRYVRLLRSTITGLGHPVPAPSPEDAHLIDQ
ncbi:hypothetical protein [Streptomyces griseus]|uniref:hypothetical protein n=1 Tax=Streptomyces griseus TaxID=1911 RepID=UPI0033ACA6B8